MNSELREEREQGIDLYAFTSAFMRTSATLFHDTFCDEDEHLEK
jgi:hypothetical protein